MSNEILKSILSGLIGNLVYVQAASFIIYLISHLLSYAGAPISFLVPLAVFTQIFLLFAIISGFITGYRSGKNRGVFYSVFFPRKSSVIMTFFASIVVNALIYAYMILHYNISSLIYLIPLTLITLSIGLFPFVSACYYAYSNRKSKQYRKFRLWIILAIIVLNPITMILSSALTQNYSDVVLRQQPCGLRIWAFNDPSPARDAGMAVNDTIIQIDGVNIMTQKDVPTYLSNATDQAREVTVKTKNGQYTFTMAWNENVNRFTMGFNTTQAFCSIFG